MLNNKAMILYDALVGFIVLSTTASVFIKILECDYKLMTQTKDTVITLEFLKEGYLGKSGLNDQNGIQEIDNGAQYCINYKLISSCIDK